MQDDLNEVDRKIKSILIEVEAWTEHEESLKNRSAKLNQLEETVIRGERSTNSTQKRKSLDGTISTHVQFLTTFYFDEFKVITRYMATYAFSNAIIYKYMHILI